MSLVIITGMSGSGKSKVVDVMEDIGYFCVDNVPPQLIAKFVELNCDQSIAEKMALVVDARSRGSFREFAGALASLREAKYQFRLLFVDAEDNVLFRRFKEGRRTHPLRSGNINLSLEEAIIREREQLSIFKSDADLVIDTSTMRLSQLKEQIDNMFLGEGGQAMTIRVMSFGFKNGAAKEADLVFDVRCLPNPFYIPELKEHTGMESCVRDYILSFPQSVELLARLKDLATFLVPLYIEEGKTQLVIAFGCTGGCHRSVMFAELVGAELKDRGYQVLIQHRDKDR